LANTTKNPFGPHTTLREVIDDNDTDPNNIPKTRIIRISEPLYRRFVGFSKRYFDVEPYDLILENLIKCYEEHNQDTYWYHNTNS
jgi:hypothetical protein